MKLTQYGVYFVIIFRKIIITLKRIHRLSYCFLLILWVLLSFLTLYWLQESCEMMQLPLEKSDHLELFRTNRSLKAYIGNIRVLIQPPTPCKYFLAVVVMSSPPHYPRRQAIRETWGRLVPTYFVLGVGVGAGGVGEYMVGENYMESKQYSDMVLLDLVDCQTTLRTMLMLHWASARCSSPAALVKVEDDVFLNPWLLKLVLAKHEGGHLIGYKMSNVSVSRNKRDARFVPRWLHPPDLVPEHLHGGGYIINNTLVPLILAKAHQIPLMNLEDVYLTHLVARALNLTLAHDAQMSPYRHRAWAPLTAVYPFHVFLHGIGPEQIKAKWKGIKDMYMKIN